MRAPETLIALVAAVLVPACALKGSAKPARAQAPDSTFYDFYLDHYLASEQYSSFATVRSELRALDEERIDAYDWSRLGTERALFEEIQTLRFVLPWLESSTHSSEARHWLMSWYMRHGLEDTGRPDWGSGLTVAQRALVLVFWLRQEERRGVAPEDATMQVLRDAIRLHEEYLALDEHFDTAGNVGVLQAIALGEAARVVRSPEALRTARQRLRSVLDAILSPLGTSLEHSAHYHFIVLAWTEAALATYAAEGNEDTQWLRAHVAGMRRAGYFLVDSGDRVVQIGDSDSTAVPGLTQRVRHDLGDPGDVFFDSLAGYAVYKAQPASKDGRYVAYRIQSGAIKYPAHCHADAMSLVAVWNGETVLGDSGRYLYGAGGLYFASPPAHNTIFPEEFLSSKAMRQMSSAFSAGRRDTADGTGWWARMDWNGAIVARGVGIPAATQAVVVEDTIQVPVSSARASRFCWTWNAGNDVLEVTLEEKKPNAIAWTMLTQRDQRIRFRMTISEGARGTVELQNGGARPELGWYSPRYGVKQPSMMVLVRIETDRMTTVRTVIEPAR
jgi:hypothetical protein